MRTTTAITSAALLLALTACGSGDDDRVAELEAELESLQAETSTDDVEAASESTETQDEPIDNEGLAPKDMDFSDDPILADREFTGRMTGDVVAGVGDTVEIDQGAFEGIGNFMGTVTLDEVVGGYECYTVTDETIEPQGELLIAEFTISADEDADEEFSFSQNHFEWRGFDDHISTSDMFACMDYANGQMDSLRPGDTVTRTYLFDVPEFAGTLSYTGATNYVDWEIERSDYDNADRLPEAAGDESVSATEDTANAETSETTASADSDPETPYSAQFPSADEVDFYGPMDHPDDLLVDINTIPDCEIAHIIWGGLQNGDMEGFDIDWQYFGLLENWMMGVGCL